MENQEKEKTTIIKYSGHDRQPHHVSGVQGGATPYDSIVAIFYLEQMMPVESVEVLASQVNSAEVYENENGSLTINRHVQTSVVFSLSTAKKILHWLDYQIKLAEAIDAGNIKGFIEEITQDTQT